MTSVAQLNANRLNAQRSTGPRTEAGKAASRFNALTYGLEARSRVIPGEDPAQLESLAAAYHGQFNPVGPLEDFLVETIVQADWNRRRYTRVEAQLYRALMAAAQRRLDAPADPDPLSELAAVFGDDVTGAKILQSAFRQLASAERSYFRALTELRRAQKERRAEERAEEAEAAPAVTLAPPRPQALAASAAATQPAPNGFVLPNPPQGGAGASDCQQGGAGAFACHLTATDSAALPPITLKGTRR
jgi:hypothetical protein